MDYLIRFLVGGAVVSGFAMLGDMIRPKSFAGIFGAAPSVALVTLALTVRSEGPLYAAVEARSMLLGAAATGIYTLLCTRLMWYSQFSVRTLTLAGLLVWMGVALLGWWLFLKGAT